LRPADWRRPTSTEIRTIPLRRIAPYHRTLGPSSELWLGLRRSAYRAPTARTLHNMPEAASASGDVERRGRTLKVQRGRPAGPRMKCGWGCAEQLTASRMRTHFSDLCQMRAHFTICAKRPAASDHVGPMREESASKARASTEAASPVRLAHGTRLTATQMREHVAEGRGRNATGAAGSGVAS
jgi:hypothetical protein